MKIMGIEVLMAMWRPIKKTVFEDVAQSNLVGRY
jgi:hypothetical protein